MYFHSKLSNTSDDGSHIERKQKWGLMEFGIWSFNLLHPKLVQPKTIAFNYHLGTKLSFMGFLCGNLMAKNAFFSIETTAFSGLATVLTTAV